MKNIISFICGILIWIIIWWATTYYMLWLIEKNNDFQPEWYNCSSPDYAQIKMQDVITVGEATDFEITIMKNNWWMSFYTGTILIIVTDENWMNLKDSEYFITQHWLYTFTWNDLWIKKFEKWLTINKEGTYYLEISDLNNYEDKVLWFFPITVINNTRDISNWNINLAHIAEVKIFDSEWNISWESDDIEFENYEYHLNRTSKNLHNYILPDSAEIKVKDPIIMWEATNLEIRILKNDATMTSYEWSIWVIVTEENWTILKDNEYTVPSHWLYEYLWSDLWDKTFQRWLQINKEWKFYIEVMDLNENEDRTLWRQLITVVNPQKSN